MITPDGETVERQGPPTRETGGGCTGLGSDPYELLKAAFETHGVFEVRLGYAMRDWSCRPTGAATWARITWG